MSLLPDPLPEDIYNGEPGHAGLHNQTNDLVNAIRDLVDFGRLSEGELEAAFASPDSVGEWVLENAAEIAAAAAALAASDAGLVRKTDPGIPQLYATPVYVNGQRVYDVVLTAGDRLIEAHDSNRKVFAGIKPDRLEFGTVARIEAVPIAGASAAGLVPDPTRPLVPRLDESTVGTDGTVPLWVLKRWAGRMGAGASAQSPIDEFPVLGQSNSTINNTLLSVLHDASGWVVRWDKATGTWVVQTGTPWLGSGIARAWWEREGQATGRRAGGPECGIGGTAFSELTVVVDGVLQSTSWDPANVTAAVNLAVRARDIILASHAAAPAGSQIKAIGWDQGEGDRGLLTGAQYAAKLDALIAWFRTELGLPNLPFIISPFTPQLRILGTTSTTDEIAAALEDTPRRVPYTAFALPNIDDSQPGEFIHFTADANHRRGAAMIQDPDPLRASTWDQALLNRDDALARTPPGLTVTRSGGEATITWGHPPTRVSSFALETCTDGVGTTWATETLAAPTTHRHVKAVAAGTPLWARIAAVSPTGTSYKTREVHA